jgi:sulfide:quinone oxidoreductase
VTERNVLVLGGGIGGVVAAHRLRRGLDDTYRVVLIDRSPYHYYAPSFLWTLTGDRQPDRIRRPLARLQSHGIQVEQAEVTHIDVEARKVTSDRGAMRFDRLVIALGVGLDPGATDGFEAAAHNFYTADGAASGRDALASLESGRVAVAVAGSPYKCPAAPWEAALLAEATLRTRGVRNRASVVVHTPEPRPMPVAPPEVGQAVLDLLDARDIEVHLEHPLDHLDADDHVLRFVDGSSDVFDVLLGVPVHRPPMVIAESSLAGPSGFIPVDPETLQTEVDGVYAIGDIAAIPLAGGKMLPKAGVFAHAQGQVVGDRIVDELAGRRPTAIFEGDGSCFLETGGSKAAYATGNFYAPQGPQLELRPPALRWHALKVALERFWLTRWWW